MDLQHFEAVWKGLAVLLSGCGFGKGLFEGIRLILEYQKSREERADARLAVNTEQANKLRAESNERVKEAEIRIAKVEAEREEARDRLIPEIEKRIKAEAETRALQAALEAEKQAAAVREKSLRDEMIRIVDDFAHTTTERDNYREKWQQMMEVMHLKPFEGH